MTRTDHFKVAATLFAALLVALVLARVASAQTVGTTAFPGSTGAIAFVSSRDGVGEWNVYRMHGDGLGQTRITSTPGLDMVPKWSANGKKLTYTNNLIGRPGEVYQVDADGTDERNLTNSPSSDGDSSYSPASSNKIVFASDRTDNQFDVYLATLDSNGQTTELIRITRSAAKDYMPAISPDGRRLVFVSDRDGDDDIYIMKARPESATNKPIKLTKNTRPDPNGPPFMVDWQPDWSPDGTQITFASNRSSDTNYEVYRMKAVPEGRTNKPVNLSRNPARDEDPAWSPDGKKIAFASDRDGNEEIYRMRATDGANQINLSNNPALDAMPAWQPLP